MAGKQSIDREVLGVVFLLMLVYANSEKLVGALLATLGVEQSAPWRIGVLFADVAMLLAAAVLKRAIARRDGAPDRLWRWWWAAFAVVVFVDVLWAAVPDAHVVVDLLTAVAYVIALAILVISALNADPRTLFSARLRRALPTDWRRAAATGPLIVGCIAAFLGATLWSDYFDPTAVRNLHPQLAREIEQLPLTDRIVVESEVCDEGINPTYFQHIADVLPVLLLALGVEFNFFRRSWRDPVQRAAMIVTVTVMCAALVLALSTLPFDARECDDILAAWHEYAAFTVTLQAVFMALATVLWLMLMNLPSGESVGDGARADRF